MRQISFIVLSHNGRLFLSSLPLLKRQITKWNFHSFHNTSSIFLTSVVVKSAGHLLLPKGETGIALDYLEKNICLALAVISATVYLREAVSNHL